MSDAPESLVFDLVEWVAKEPRTYAAMLDAWRTSCPRLTVWEDAIERRLVMRKPVAGQGTMVVVTAAGRRFIAERQPSIPAGALRSGARASIPSALTSVHSRS
jgi:hypothetical protein